MDILPDGIVIFQHIIDRECEIIFSNKASNLMFSE